MTDFAVDPSDDRHLVAVAGQGLLETGDEGGGWRPAGDPDAQHVVWPRKNLLLTTDASGEVRSSSDGGGTFEYAGRLAAPAEAPLMDKTGVLYAALKGGRIQRSQDDGQTWSTVIRLVTR